MTKKIEALICDVDGTLYPFVGSADGAYKQSKFATQVQNNVRLFIADILAVSPAETEAEFERLTDIYGEDFSIAFEREYGILRQDYFNRTWSIAPDDFVSENMELRLAFERINAKKAIISSAPRVWVMTVIYRLRLASIFSDDMISTGETDIRKPQARAFTQICDKMAIPYERIVSIGDQEETDIIPAKKLGMTTILIARAESSVADYVVPDILSALRLVEDMSA